MSTQYWTIWYPKAAATGLLVARALLESTGKVLLHAAPEVVTVEVSDAEGNPLATGKDLKSTQNSPICRLTTHRAEVIREDIWPDTGDIGSKVILPGGEAGVLKSWWNAEDRKGWRWQVEFYNTTR